MQCMEAPEPVQPTQENRWHAKLIPLQGSVSETDIDVTHTASRLLTARCRGPLAPGLPVRIDQHDTILLGEIVACRQEAPGEFSLLIELNESLSGLHSLRNLVSALLGEARADEPAHPLDPYCQRRAETERRQREAEMQRRQRER
jgi:hypothetical protein